MKAKEEITFSTTAYHYPDEGGIESADIHVKMNIVGNQIFYHVTYMSIPKRNFMCAILILKNVWLFSNEYNYTFQHEKKNYYLKIDI
ncbi:hypothetical protein EZS27_026088 [termite gut metagenome]|uniref:Uncharacterized protein n=1 Tax=termite gut metagenome TaxID=433724 RepID=A0A5J4QU18_9ZZZZ